MSETELLQSIQDSLTAKPAEAEPEQTTKQASSSNDLAEALLELPQIMSQLKALTVEKQKANDTISVITQLDYSIQQLSDQTSLNLSTISKVQRDLDVRLKNFELMEAKYHLLIDNINRVLPQLERVLKEY